MKLQQKQNMQDPRGATTTASVALADRYHQMQSNAKHLQAPDSQRSRCNHSLPRARGILG